ncbi:LysR family transcriptional regulator [Propionivibrio limicola]|uniref:LysR family transcriptional regulator n=1 Tax=Propionivibrio limicola TaxID=167645 RepID=UPI001290BCD0|nr:LysR family transcriptional regulator [Propionivibrio limicola]
MKELFNASHYLDIRDLQLIDILYATRSVTQTAEILGQTQPAVSIGLKRIRERVNDPLFVKTSEGMSPTPRADELVVKGRQVIETVRQLCDQTPTFDPQTSQRIFRICVPDAAQITLLPKILQHTRVHAPNVQIEALPIDDETAARLGSGEADLAFGGFVPKMNDEFYQQALYEQDYICLVSPRHPRIGDHLTLEDYQREAHVTVSYGGSNAIVSGEMKRLNIERKILLSLPGFLGVSRVVAVTDMITTLPRQIGEDLAELTGLRVVNCPVPLPIYKVKQYWHPRYHLDPGNQWLRKLCALTAQTPPAKP